MDIVEFKERMTQIFDDTGFITLKSMLDPDTTAQLRAYIKDQFLETSPVRPFDLIEKGNLGSIKLDVFSRFPELYQRIFFNSALVFHLKLLLGDNFAIIPETGIHKNSFGGWHKDVAAHQRLGLTFHWEEGFRIVTIAFYLQENTEQYGGGLDVIPGSHRIRFPTYEPTYKGHSLPTSPGDVVIFNHNLDHKASWPSMPVDEGNTKYSLFFCASTNNEHARRYMDFLKIRPEYQFMNGYSYPDDLVQHAAAQGYVLLK